MGVSDSLAAALKRQLLTNFPATSIPKAVDLPSSGMNPLVARFLKAVLDRHVVDECNRMSYDPSEWIPADRRSTVDESIREARRVIGESVSFPDSRWEYFIGLASEQVCRYLVSPIDTLFTYIFPGDADSVSSATARKRLRSFGAYTEILDSIASSLPSDPDAMIRRMEFRYKLDEVARDAGQSVTEWDSFAEPLFSLHEEVNGSRLVPNSRLTSLAFSLWRQDVCDRLDAIERSQNDSDISESLLVDLMIDRPDAHTARRRATIVDDSPEAQPETETELEDVLPESAEMFSDENDDLSDDSVDWQSPTETGEAEWAASVVESSGDSSDEALPELSNGFASPASETSNEDDDRLQSMQQFDEAISAADALESDRANAWERDGADSAESSRVESLESSHVESLDGQHAETHESSHAETLGSSNAEMSGSNRTETSKSSHAETSGSSHAETSGLSHAETSGANRAETSGSNRTETLGSNRAETSGANRAETSGSNHTGSSVPNRAESFASNRDESRASKLAEALKSNHAAPAAPSRAQSFESNRAESRASKLAEALKSSHAASSTANTAGSFESDQAKSREFDRVESPNPDTSSNDNVRDQNASVALEPTATEHSTPEKVEPPHNSAPAAQDTILSERLSARPRRTTNEPASAGPVPLWKQFHKKLNAPIASDRSDTVHARTRVTSERTVLDNKTGGSETSGVMAGANPTAEPTQPETYSRSETTVSGSPASHQRDEVIEHGEESVKPLWLRYQSKNSKPAEMKARQEAENLSDIERRVFGRADLERRNRFVNELFDGSEISYADVLKEIDSADEWSQASHTIAHNVFRRYRINIYSDVAVTFTNAVEQRFLK